MPGMEHQRVAFLRHANFGAMCTFLGVLTIRSTCHKGDPRGGNKHGGDGAASPDQAQTAVMVQVVFTTFGPEVMSVSAVLP